MCFTAWKKIALCSTECLQINTNAGLSTVGWKSFHFVSQLLQESPACLSLTENNRSLFSMVWEEALARLLLAENNTSLFLVGWKQYGHVSRRLSPTSAPFPLLLTRPACFPFADNTTIIACCQLVEHNTSSFPIGWKLYQFVTHWLSKKFLASFSLTWMSQPTSGGILLMAV